MQLHWGLVCCTGHTWFKKLFFKATIDEKALASTWTRSNMHGSVWLFSLLKDCCCNSTLDYYTKWLSLINRNTKNTRIIKILNTTRKLYRSLDRISKASTLSQLLYFFEVADLAQQISTMITETQWSNALLQRVINYLNDILARKTASEQKMIRNRKRRGRSIPSAVSG